MVQWVSEILRAASRDGRMTKTQYYCAATLDGYLADADDGLEWLFGYEGAFEGEGTEQGPFGEGGAYERFYDRIGALVSGSTTYEFVVDHAGEDGEWPYPGKPWWVLSSRDLPLPEGDGVDVRVVDGDVGDLRAEIMESAGGRNVWIVGGGNVASQFADEGLLDELVLTVVPVVLGEGKPLFDRGLRGPMQLLGTTVFHSGMVELRYGIGPNAP